MAIKIAAPAQAELAKYAAIAAVGALAIWWVGRKVSGAVQGATQTVEQAIAAAGDMADDTLRGGSDAVAAVSPWLPTPTNALDKLADWVSAEWDWVTQAVASPMSGNGTHVEGSW